MPLVDSLAVVALGAIAFVLDDSLTVYFACDTHTPWPRALVPRLRRRLHGRMSALVMAGSWSRSSSPAGSVGLGPVASDRLGLNHGPAAG